MAEYNKGKYGPRYVPDEKYRPKPRNPNQKPEKVWGFTVASFFGLLAVFAAKYAVDFLLLPRLFPDAYPFSVGVVVAWVLTTIIFSFASMKLVTGMGIFYPFADLVYAILVAIWPLGLYGAEFVPGFVLAIIMAAIMYALQRAILWILILVGFMKM